MLIIINYCYFKYAIVNLIIKLVVLHIMLNNWFLKSFKIWMIRVK